MRLPTGHTHHHQAQHLGGAGSIALLYFTPIAGAAGRRAPHLRSSIPLPHGPRHRSSRLCGRHGYPHLPPGRVLASAPREPYQSMRGNSNAMRARVFIGCGHHVSGLAATGSLGLETPWRSRRQLPTGHGRVRSELGNHCVNRGLSVNHI